MTENENINKQQEQTYTTYTKDNLTFTKDNQGKTISVEGYLKEQSGKRPQTEETAQKEVQKEMNVDKNGKSYYDASHIIAYELGGKGGKDNIVLMPQGINRSYLRSVEKELKEQLKKQDQVEVKATLTWGENDKIPEKIRYEAWGIKKETGEKTKIHDSETKVNYFPEKTLSQTLKQSQDLQQNTKQWSSQEQSGISKTH